MKKKFNLGKIDFHNTGRKINAVEIEIGLKESSGIDYETLKELQKTLVFSASASVWNNKHTDIVVGGQCLDTLAEYPEIAQNPIFRKIYPIWQRYHLNNFNAGTKKQTEEVEKYLKDGKKYDYTGVCEYLKSINLYEDNGYKYGHGWLIEQIPAETTKEIESLFQES